jgi:hypothetical protein
MSEYAAFDPQAPIYAIMNQIGLHDSEGITLAEITQLLPRSGA